MSTGITQSPRPSSSRFRWTPADIALGAALGVGCGLVFWGFNFAYTPISSVLGSILPGIASVLHAVWYFSGTLAVLILRKPGAAVYVNVVGSAVEMLLGNNFAFGFVFISAILQGVFAEIPFAATRYRVFNLPMAVLSGLCTARPEAKWSRAPVLATATNRSQLNTPAMSAPPTSSLIMCTMPRGLSNATP